MGVFTFTNIECRHHFVHIVAASFSIQNSMDETHNEWKQMYIFLLCVCSNTPRRQNDSPKTNSLIFVANFLIERPFAHQQFIGIWTVECFAPEILIAMIDVIIGHFDPLISSR